MKIFISYAHDDDELVTQLVDILRNAGHESWIDTEKLIPGIKWQDGLRQAISESDAAILAVTPKWLESSFCQWEFMTAVRLNKPIIPLLLKETKLPKSISELQYVDLSKGVDEQSNIDKLLDGLFQLSTLLATQNSEVQTLVEQDRRLEVAMPQLTRANSKTELWAKISLPTSPGLDVELPSTVSSGDTISKGDRRASFFPISFERDKNTGKLKAAPVCLEVISNDFIVTTVQPSADPCSGKQVHLEIPPERDSRTVIFDLKLKPKRSQGYAKAKVVLYQNGRVVAETSVLTQIVSDYIPDIFSKGWNLEHVLLQLQPAAGVLSSTFIIPASFISTSFRADLEEKAEQEVKADNITNNSRFQIRQEHQGSRSDSSGTQSASVGDIIGGEVHIHQESSNGKEPSCVTRIAVIVAIITLIATIVMAIAAVVGIVPAAEKDHFLYTLHLIGPSATPTQTPSLTPTITPQPTSTNTPKPSVTPTPIPKPMERGFNIAVARFAYRFSDGSIGQTELADEISDQFFEALVEIDGINEKRDKDDIGIIDNLTSEEREKQAAILAEEFNATILIYGIVWEDESFIYIEPRLHIRDHYTNDIDPDLSRAIFFRVAPIPRVGINPTNPPPDELETQIQIIHYTIAGLEAYIKTDFNKSREQFEEAIKIDPSVAVLYVLAGNASLREEERDLEASFKFFSQALAVEPDYPRALVGRGIALFEMVVTQSSLDPEYIALSSPDFDFDPASPLPTQFDSCTKKDLEIPEDPQTKIKLAMLCHEQVIKWEVSSADVDVKATFELAQIQMWLSSSNKADYWNSADGNFEYVINSYLESETPRLERIRPYAGHSYAWRAEIILEKQPFSVENVSRALSFFEEAVSLLSIGEEKIFNALAIKHYEDRENTLEIWLDNQRPATPVEP